MSDQQQQPQYFMPRPEAKQGQDRVVNGNNQRRFNRKELDLENGKTVLRILPQKSQDAPFSRLKSMWFQARLDWTCINDKVLPVLSEMWPGTDDPILNALIKINQFEDVSKLFPGAPKFLFNVLILSHRPEGGSEDIRKPDWHIPKVLRLPKTMNDWIWARVMDSTLTPICDPVNGWWISITKTGQKLETRYDPNLEPELPRAISDDPNVVQQIMNKMTDLEKFVGSPDGDMIVKQQAVADELLRKYRLPAGGAPQQGISAPNIAVPTVGTPTAPQAPAAPQSPAAPQAPAAPQSPAAPQAPAAPPPPQTGGQPPFPGSATPANAAVAPMNPATVPATPSVAGPAPTGGNPMQGVSADVPECFAGLSEENPFLNAPKCRVCHKEMECREIDKKRILGEAYTPPQPAQNPTPSPSPQAPAVPAAPSSPEAASPPAPPQTASTDAPAAPSAPSMNDDANASSPSDGDSGLPPCYGNKGKGQPPAEGYECESCAFRLICERET